jgi:hypothetical protein
MLVGVDLPGAGADENEPCENKPWNGEFATCNNWNGFERSQQFRYEALSGSRGQSRKGVRTPDGGPGHAALGLQRPRHVVGSRGGDWPRFH